MKISKCPASYHNSLLNQRVAAIRFFHDGDYIYVYMSSLFILNLYKNRFSGTGLQPNLKISDVIELVTPIPPLEEQSRIVSKVNELLSICEDLKSKIFAFKAIQEKYADVIVEQTVK